MARQFQRCSVDMKLKLFISHCVCFYDIHLRFAFHRHTINSQLRTVHQMYERKHILGYQRWRIKGFIPQNCHVLYLKGTEQQLRQVLNLS